MEKGKLLIKQEINSIEEVTEVLDYARSIVPVSMQNVIKMQMTVLKYVQSPTLIDTTLTSLISQYEHALKYAQDLEDKENIKQNFQCIIHNYVFFLDARTQWALDRNSELAREIFCDASELLALSVRDIIRSSLHIGVAGGKIISSETATVTAVGSMSGKATDNIMIGETDKQYERSTQAIEQAHAAIDKIVVNDLFGEERINFLRSIVGKIFDWGRNKKKKEEFNESMRRLIEKLIKYKKLIGPSIIISDMIDRYIDDAYPKPEEKEGFMDTFSKLFILVLELIIGLLIGIGRACYYSDKEAPDNWFLYHMLCVVAIMIVSAYWSKIIMQYKLIKHRKHIKKLKRVFKPY